jgi:hypothetical protein
VNALARRAPGCVSDLALDRLLAGELAGSDEGNLVRAHIATCDACRARHDELRADLATFEQQVSVPQLVAKTHRRIRTARRWPSVAVAGLVACAALYAVWLLPHAPTPGDVRLKGGPALSVVARDARGNVRALLSGDTVAPGESVRFKITTSRGGFGYIVGLDRSQAVSPYAVDFAVAAGVQWLPGSIVLDETLGTERVVALVCARRTGAEPVLAAGRRALAAAGGVPEKVQALNLRDCEETAYLLRKHKGS